MKFFFPSDGFHLIAFSNFLKTLSEKDPPVLQATTNDAKTIQRKRQKAKNLTNFLTG
jgi:hypothetical protein